MVSKKYITTVKTMVFLPEELGEEILCEVDFHMENDGIGHYEYWGQKCFDSGFDFMEIDDIRPVFVSEPEYLHKSIITYIDRNWEEVCNATIQRIEETAPYPTDDGI